MSLDPRAVEMVTTAHKLQLALRFEVSALSRKPEAFMDLVESVSPGPYLELFSRRARLGWQTWGDESLHGGEAA